MVVTIPAVLIVLALIGFGLGAFGVSVGRFRPEWAGAVLALIAVAFLTGVF